MELRQIRHLIALAETKNFHQAADRLQISQQAVSKSLMQLERSLGVRLVDRDRQSVMLTPFGELLLPHATAMMAEIGQFEDALANSQGKPSGRLRIGATPTLLAEIVPATLKLLYERYPDTIGVVERFDYANLENSLLLGQLDVVLSTSPDATNPRLVTVEQLCEDRNVILVRKGHALDGLKPVLPDQLLDFPRLAMLNFTSAESFMRKIFAGQTPPPARLTTSSDSFAISWLQQSAFYCVAPYRRFSRHLREGSLAAVDVGLTDNPWPLVMVTRRRATRPPVVQAYMNIVRDFVAAATVPTPSDSLNRLGPKPT